MVEKEERLPMGPLDGGLSSIFPLGRVLIILLLSKNWFLKAKWRDTWMGTGTVKKKVYFSFEVRSDGLPIILALLLDILVLLSGTWD